ncbi:MAG: AAA family ATPase [Microcystis sp. M038S2]|jgi:succinoglycan biosynthesis transport protein ExoP|uniref:AAA family ATPase n=1 Tax=Microcystis aeruginosa G11-04 TaxID=2685956 RepID=A0A966L5D2_MICAE|nr:MULTISPECIES: tyrosine-protein kinase domain-containing protein [unclassified Microcystis]NCR27276.1 AAA family ATPase [Microcystis aeruginosa LE13-04]NCS11861.1 AAA family ATPase [Microcystis aeruginosa G13-09]NCS40189.1 AAA family ATPase [Microcystis aeruginosa BS13-10]NCS57653.1 AAA family ATPase [Microcystis aeruginosa G11-04]TRU57557.1 MAG: ATPase [Microcystis aeruginosa Ma_QC_C_20070823_S13D]TRU61472.1 MAG: ATPase [Microcystis aeruginosa Ma_QC_C_20070823_S13]
MALPIVKRFLISLDQNKFVGIFVFLVCLGGSVIFALLPDPEKPPTFYRAVGQLAYRVPPPAFTSIGTQLQEQGRAIDRDLLLSPRVLVNAAKKLQFNQEQIVKIRDQDLKITFPGEVEGQKNNSNRPTETDQPQEMLLELTADSQAKAELILETLMKEMVEYSRWLNTSQLRARIEALSVRLNEVQKDLTRAEEKFYRYISTQGSDLLAIQDGSLFTAITSSQQQQREIRLELQGIQGQINSLSEQLDLTPDQAYTSSALSADPIIASIRAQILGTEAQLERLQKDLRPEHPTVAKLRKEQQVNESLLQKRAAEVIGKDGILTDLPSSRIRQQSNLDATRQQLAAQLVTLQTQREGLMKQLESLVTQEQQLRSQYEKFPDKQLQQARLTQAVAFQRGIYENILNALVDAQAAEAETVGSLTVAQPPVAQPIEQVFNRKNRTLILLVGAGLGTLAGLGTILLLAVIDDRLHSPQELREALVSRDILLLGQLPIVRNLEGEEIEPILADANANYLPYYERLRSTLRLVGGGETVKVVIVTSITGGEGKTATAYNLAIAASLAGRRTLLVEGDLRSLSKAEEIGVTPDPNSFREPLLYYGAKSKSIRLAPNIENLSILPSPGPQKQAAAIIESSELQLILKDSRGRFDLVIVDTPSLSSCNDALLLEELADGIILVTRQAITRSSLLSEATDQLTEAEVKILGAVINYVDITPTLNTAEPELPPLIVPPLQEKTETEEVKVEV